MKRGSGARAARRGEIGTSLLTADRRRADAPLHRGRDGSPSRCARPRDRRGASGAVGLGTRRLESRSSRARSPASKRPPRSARSICAAASAPVRARGPAVGRILLDHAGFVDRERFLNARRTLAQLLADRVVPLINENDSVATNCASRQRSLAAQVVNTCGADLLILLTDVDGLRDRDPRAGRATPRRGVQG